MLGLSLPLLPFITVLTDLFTPPADPSLLQYGLYDPKLVVLSLLVATFASLMGLQMAGHSRSANSAILRTGALLAGSLALGSGIWAMHFIGMLAFDLCTRITYNPVVTLLSLLPGLGAATVALTILRRPTLTPGVLLTGGVLAGAGIGAMHYSGMAAMQTGLQLRYDPWMFALSIVVAVVLATVALGVRFGLRGLRDRFSHRQRLAMSALVMGCAITGMHYTGMAAARFVGTPPPGALSGNGAGNTDFVALAVSAITVLFTVVVMGANGLLRYREMYRQLHRSESWMRALLTTTVDGVVTVDRDGIIHEFNLSAERIFGWRRDEIVNRHVSTLMGDTGSSEQNGFLHFLKTGDGAVTRAGSEVLGLHKDGSCVPIRRAVGHARLTGADLFVLFITDISERRAIMQALRDSERQFRSLIGNIPGISFRCHANADYLVEFLSDGVESVTGYPAADFVGPVRRRTLVELVAPADLPRVMAVCDGALLAGSAYTVEYRMRHADGSWRWVWEHGAVVTGDDGTPRWVDGVILDMTERHQMEEDLRLAKEKAEHAAAARASFVANMSHEIRTPMNAILGFTDVLLDDDLQPQQRAHLDTVRNAGRALLRLLNEILDTAKLEKGAVELELDDFSLLVLIDELSSTYNTTARSKGLTLNIAFDPSLSPWLHGDELRMRQVLTNLLDNAIKFTAVGSVTIEVAAQEEQLHIAVTDTGIGIAPERLAAIFDPFTQADASMTRRFGGTGLGTTISKQLVELMGGKIWADSTPGQGTTFHVVVPLVPAQQPERRQQPRQRQNIAFDLPPLRVLAADDVAQNLELLALLMTKRGHQLTTARDGATAADLAASGEFDVILMDVQMPHVDGLAATRIIRAEAQCNGRRRVPIVAMTASVLEAHRKASTSAGMDGFASKPVDWYALSHEIARVLGLDRTTAAGTLAATKAAGPQVLNRTAAVARWGASEAALQQALGRFRHDHGGCAATLAQLAAQRDFDAMRAHAHRVRGVAANLGFEQLAALLAELEQSDGAEQHGMADGAAWPALLARLDTQLALALEAAGEYPETAPPCPGTTAAMTFDGAAVRTAATALQRSLARGALDDAALARLSLALQGHVPPATLAPLHMALGDFDFTLAETRLNVILGTVFNTSTELQSCK